MHLELERGDHTKIAATAAQAPKQIFVLCHARDQQLAVRRHHIGRHEIVEGQTMLAHQPPEPATQGQTRDAGSRNKATRGSESESLKVVVQLAHEAPPSTRAMRVTGSIRTDFIDERSITRPPSQSEVPATLCPVPRMATKRPCERAKFTAPITSATPAQRTMKSGRRSIIALWILRAAS